MGSTWPGAADRARLLRAAEAQVWGRVSLGPASRQSQVDASKHRAALTRLSTVGIALCVLAGILAALAAMLWGTR